MTYFLARNVELSSGHEIATTGDDLARMVRAVQAHPDRALDFEGNGLNWAKGARPIGYSLGFIPAEGGWPRAWYVPFAHRDIMATQADPDAARRAFGDALKGATSLIGHNLKFDLNFGRAAGFEIPRDAQIHDTMIQGHLTYEKRALDLESVAANEGVSRWGDPFEAKNAVEAFLIERAKAHRLPLKKDDKRAGKAAYLTRFGHSEVPVALEAEYSCRDVAHALCLDAKMRARAMGIGAEYEDRRRYMYRNEMMLVRAIAEMEWAGQPVDKDYMIELGHDLERTVDMQIDSLNKLFGVRIDWSSDAAVRRFLYESLRLPVVKMTDGGREGLHRVPAVDREAIDGLSALDPRLADLAEFKAHLKALQSFTFSLAWHVGDDGRIHASFLQHGTDSGRFSSRDPNFQNIQKRHKKLAARIRQGWVLPPGWGRIYNDYSQVELRMMGWICGAKTFVNAYRSPAYDAWVRGEIDYDAYRWYRRFEPPVDIHGNVCHDVFGIDASHPDWEFKRRCAKVVNFGVPYGGGVNLLVANPDIKMDLAAAQAFLADYSAANAEIAVTKDRLFRKMKSRRGTPWFANWAGRTVHGPRLRHGDEDVRAEEERSMFACLVQGSAGELTRYSLVRWYERYIAGTLPAVASSTIHDEIQYDCEIEAMPYVASETQRIGEDFKGLFGTTPMVLDQKATTSTWADAHDYSFFEAA